MRQLALDSSLIAPLVGLTDVNYWMLYFAYLLMSVDLYFLEKLRQLYLSNFVHIERLVWAKTG